MKTTANLLALAALLLTLVFPCLLLVGVAVLLVLNASAANATEGR
jgi:hypothetical protein